MRIGLNTPDPQAASTEKLKKSSVGTAGSVGANGLQGKQDAGDRVSLSDLASQAMGMPEIRQEKVEALRQSVSSGQYQPNSDESAEAILSQ